MRKTQQLPLPLAGYSFVMKSLFSRGRSSLVLIACIMCISALVATSIFISWNLVLVLTNNTSIEFWSTFLDKQHNIFHLGVRDNLRQVFGLDSTWVSWLMPKRGPPPGDGCVYTMKVEGRILFDHDQLRKREPETVSLLV